MLTNAWELDKTVKLRWCLWLEINNKGQSWTWTPAETAFSLHQSLWVKWRAEDNERRGQRHHANCTRWGEIRGRSRQCVFSLICVLCLNKLSLYLPYSLSHICPLLYLKATMMPFELCHAAETWVFSHESYVGLKGYKSRCLFFPENMPVCARCKQFQKIFRVLKRRRSALSMSSNSATNFRGSRLVTPHL